MLVPYALGWSGIQWTCALALLLYSPLVLRVCWRLWTVGPADAQKQPLDPGPHRTDDRQLASSAVSVPGRVARDERGTME